MKYLSNPSNYIKRFFNKSIWFRNILNEKESLKKCGCSCKCVCGNILNINSKCEETKEQGLYKYTCNDCLKISYFHYDIAPVPIKFREDQIKGLIWNLKQNLKLVTNELRINQEIWKRVST